MKYIINLLLFLSLITGFILTSSNDNISNYIYKTCFYYKNIHNNITQNLSLNNSNTKTTSYLMHEYFTSIIYSKNSNNLTSIIDSSNFLMFKDILSFENTNIEFNHNKMLLLNENNHLPFINKENFKGFKYDEYSICFLKPTLLNYKDLCNLYDLITTLKKNNYIPFCFLDKNHINNKILNICTNFLDFIIIEDSEINNYILNDTPIFNISTNENFSCFFQINLFICNSNLHKLRFKIFPTDKNSSNTLNFEEITNFLNITKEKSKLNWILNENFDYIYFDYDILKNSY